MQNGVIEIRPRHLICASLFAGVGYGPDFVRNFRKLIKLLNGGAPILLVSGRDDICRGLDLPCCPHEQNDGACEGRLMKERDMVALYELKNYVFTRHPLQIGYSFRPKPEEITILRENFALIRGACCGSWYDFCTEIAANGFKGTEAYPEVNALLRKNAGSRLLSMCAG